MKVSAGSTIIKTWTADDVVVASRDHFHGDLCWLDEIRIQTV